MIDELNLASFLLDTALDRYFKACSSIRQHYLQDGSLGVLPDTLSQRVASEALILSEHELKLKKARAEINWVRKFSTHLVPVNSLPPEVLARIFRFALGSKSIGNMHRHPRLNRANDRNTTSSEVLSHVCSYWRRVALSSPQLWTRIDLSPCPETSAGLLPRSATFAQRAGGALLDIYVTDPTRDWCTSATLDHFIRAVAPRIRSINLQIYQTIRTDAYRNALSACLSCCIPGTLTTLVAAREPDNLASTYVFFDVPDSGTPEHGVGFYQQLYTQTNEAVLLSITSMRLHGFYPFWTSKAYYGLVELRLTRRITEVPISESHLRGILQACPGLCILEFSLNIVDPLPEGSVAPVRLDCLEVLNVRAMHYSFLPVFLGMIYPGSRPLRLSLTSAPNEGDPRLSFNSSDTHFPFFSRANITTLHATDFNKYELLRILRVCPQLQALAWDGYNTPDEPESNTLMFHPRLQSLYFIWCEVGLDMFPRWINLPALKRLVFYRCTIYQNGESEDRLDESQVRVELPGVDPVVNFIDFDMPNPIEEWELFDPDS